jgi:hypothetical protein
LTTLDMLDALEAAIAALRPRPAAPRHEEASGAGLEQIRRAARNTRPPNRSHPFSRIEEL